MLKPTKAVLVGIWLLTIGGFCSAQDNAARILTLKSRVFENTRHLRVLLPPGYHAPANRDRRYPVCYFTDGIAAWDAWAVPETANALWRHKKITELIFVAIDNGGSTRESTDPLRDRAGEYLPYPDQTWTEHPPEPRGKRFPRFLFEEVLPLVNAEYRTRPDAIGLAGSSYGGAVALYTAITHPGRIGFLLLESPSLHIGDERLLADAAAARQWPGLIYLGAGTAEGDTPRARQQMVTNLRRLQATLEKLANGPRLHVVIQEGGVHWYDAWKARLPEALEFLYAQDRP